MSRRRRPSKPRFGAEYQPAVDTIRVPLKFPLVSIHHELPDTAISSLHIHNLLEIGYCHRGDGVFVVEHKVLPFSAGCATVISEREFHFAQSSPGTTSHWTFHQLDPIAMLGTVDDLDVARVSLVGGPEFPNVLTPERHPELTLLVRELDAEAWSKAPGRRAVFRGLLQLLLAKLDRVTATANDDVGRERHGAIRRVAPALAAIAGHFDETIDVSDLAEACRLSPTHFRRLFREALCESPTEYLGRLRVQKAAALLGSGRYGVLDAALACGFNSLSAFSRQFRALYGESPRAWRAKQLSR
jgi:AraC-like DNA-binding protein